jgi:hypothetical protein
LQATATPELKRTASARLARGGASCVIGLGAIRRAAGERWDKMRPTVHPRLEDILSRKLGPSDYFVRLDEDSYLVTMPAVEPEEAQVCCLRVAHELHVGLIGACTIAQLQIANATATDDDTLELTSIVAPQLLTLAERACLDELVGARDAGRRFSVRLPIAKTENDGLVRSFIPIWDARADATSAYRCVVNLPAGDPATLTPNARTVLKIALVALESSVAALQAGHARGERFVLHLRVPFQTLAYAASRMEFVSACRGLSHELRSSLFFEIAELPIGVPQSRLGDLVATMRPFGRGVTAEVALRSPTLAIYQGIGLHAIGLDLSAPQDSLTLTEIERLGASARRLGLLAYLNEVPSGALVAFARDAGIRWMSGPAIAGAMDKPRPMNRLYTNQIFRRARKAIA